MKTGVIESVCLGSRSDRQRSGSPLTRVSGLVSNLLSSLNLPSGIL
jgi:hypothetical protein